MNTTIKSMFYKGKSFFIATIITLTSILYSNSVNAQVGFSIGPKAGVTITSFSGNNAGSVSAETRALGGAFINIHFLDYFALQPEAMFHQKGATRTSAGGDTKITVNYFEVPVLFKLMFPIEQHIYPHVFVGPTFSYKTDATYSSSESSGSDIKVSANDIRNTDIGAVGGAGIDFETNHFFINLDARYGLGFNKLSDSAVGLNIRNNNITIMLGLGYRIGTKKTNG